MTKGIKLAWDLINLLVFHEHLRKLLHVLCFWLISPIQNYTVTFVTLGGMYGVLALNVPHDTAELNCTASQLEVSIVILHSPCCDHHGPEWPLKKATLKHIHSNPTLRGLDIRGSRALVQYKDQSNSLEQACQTCGPAGRMRPFASTPAARTKDTLI
jgi:hypothetical protein